MRLPKIAKRDWDRIADLAARIANAASANEDARDQSLTESMLVELEKLEKKYGPHPSMLATRADYESDVKQQIGLLRSAYALAEKSDDQMNKTLIAGSIAWIYWEERRDVARTQRWLDVLRSCLKSHFDESEHKVYLSLRRRLAAHRRRSTVAKGR